MAEAVGECGASSSSSSIQEQAPQRRPRVRVREVSSRFMTPSAAHSSSSSSSSLSPLPNQKQRSNSVQRQRSTTPSYADQNTNDLNRSLPQQQQRKPNQPRAVAKLIFKDNRPDTPTLTTTSRSRQQQRCLNSSSSSNLSAASKLLRDSSGLSSSSTCLESVHTVTDNNINNQLVRSLPDLRSSVPDAEMTWSGTAPSAIVVSSRYLTGKSNSRVPISTTAPTPDSPPCSRSLHLPRSTCVAVGVGGDSSSSSSSSFFHSITASDRKYNNLIKVGLPLPPPPPLPPYAKPASTADVPKKGKRVPGGHQEDAHLLKLLHNRSLQWRYANAKSQASIQSQAIESQRTLYSISIKIEELRELVTRKRTELGHLQRMRTLSKILEVQDDKQPSTSTLVIHDDNNGLCCDFVMPYLDEWLTFEGVFSISLSEAIQSLLNVSVQLPASGNVKADMTDVEGALNSSMKLMESIAFHIGDLLQKAEQIEILVSELARLSGGERAHIEECGDLLSKTYQSQVEEGSLQSQLIQLRRSSRGIATGNMSALSLLHNQF